MTLFQKTLLSLCLSLNLATMSWAQVRKFGEASREDLEMTTYEADPDAEAVMLCNMINIGYDFKGEDFLLNYEHKYRIKILKEEGLSFANIEIRYFEKTASNRSQIKNLKATAYNLEDGKVVKTRLKNDLIFREKIDDSNYRLKFTVPQTKVGTVIEITYDESSTRYFMIDDWYAQKSIPVVYAQYVCTVPEYFTFSTEQTGSFHLSHKREPISTTFNVSGTSIRCNADYQVFYGGPLPALKGDDYVWQINDYQAKVVQDINFVKFPNHTYRSFNSSWPKVDSLLVEEESFGKLLRMENPFSSEQAQIDWSKSRNLRDSIATLRQLLFRNLTWDENYGLWGKSPRRVLKEGTGSNAELNFILLSMMRDAGIRAYPAVFSRRSQGRLPLTHPSIVSLNTMTIAVPTSNPKEPILAVDCSSKSYGVGVLPPTLMVDQARVIAPMGKGGWVDLRNTSKARSSASITLDLSPDALLKGNYSGIYREQEAAFARNAYRKAKDSLEYVEKLASREHIDVLEYSLSGLDDNEAAVNERITFEKQLDGQSDHLYLSPFLFIHSNSPFTKAERLIPVEYGYCTSNRLSTQINLPENYQIESCPEPLIIESADGSISCRILTQVKERNLVISYSFNRNTMIHLPSDYEFLKEFWRLIEEKTNEFLVLKKV